MAPISLQPNTGFAPVSVPRHAVQQRFRPAKKNIPQTPAERNRFLQFIRHYVAEFNPLGPSGPTVYQKWFTGWLGAPQSNPKPIWRLVGNGRITLDTQKRLPMYHKLDRILMTELLEVPLISVSKYQVVNAKLQDMYVAFTDFNTGLRSAWLS